MGKGKVVEKRNAESFKDVRSAVVYICYRRIFERSNIHPNIGMALARA